MKLLIVDDHPVVLNGTKALLETVQQWQIETEVNSENVLTRLHQETFDLCMLDINMEPISGVTLAEQITIAYPHIRIILYTGYELTDYYHLLLTKKVHGLLSKTATIDQVIQTVGATLRGEYLLPEDFIDYVVLTNKQLSEQTEQPLSGKELQILQFVAKGYTNKAIAIELQLSQRTIENHLTKIFSRLQVESRAEAVMKAKDTGLLQ